MKKNIIGTLVFFVLAAGSYILLRQGMYARGLVVHEAVAEAILAGNGWGRQMLAGSAAYPPLPTILLAIFQWAGALVPWNGAVALIAAMEALVVLQLLLLVGWRRCWCILLPLAIPLLFRSIQQLDIGWLAAALFVAGIAASIRWCEAHSLRELVIAGTSFGVLALCGPFAAAVGLAGALWMWWASRPEKGVGTLLLTPWLYCIFLLLLWNWLVLGNPFYAVATMFAEMKGFFSAAGDKLRIVDFRLLLSLLFPVAPLFTLSSKSNQKYAARTLICCFLLLLCYIPLSLHCHWPHSGIASFTVALLLLLCALGARAKFPKATSRNAMRTAICLSLIYPFMALPLQIDYCKKGPSKDEITEVVDVLWPESRIVTYGTVVPALYLDAEEKRFIARLEYWEDELKEMGKSEQLHLLLPPPVESSILCCDERLRRIGEEGAPWLFLEKEWQSGWQLWRVLGYSPAAPVENSAP